MYLVFKRFLIDGRGYIPVPNPKLYASQLNQTQLSVKTLLKKFIIISCIQIFDLLQI